MAENKPQNNRKNELKYYLMLAVNVALAAGAALLFRRSAGILAMFPLAALICLGASFAAINPFLRTGIFAVMVFIFNTTEQSDLSVTLTFTVIIAATALLFGLGAGMLLKKRFLRGSAFVAAGLAAAIIAGFIFVGNPFTAIKAGSAVDSFIAGHYPEDAVSVGGETGKMTLSPIYYDVQTDSYVKEAVWSRLPSETAEFSYNRAGIVGDTFKNLLSAKLLDESSADLYVTLHRLRPDVSFSVEGEDIVGFPSKEALSSGGGSAAAKVSYVVRIGGVQTFSEFAREVKKCVDALDSDGFEYNVITFTGGAGYRYHFTASVEAGNHHVGGFVPVPAITPTDGGRFFNDLAEKFCPADPGLR